MVNLTMSIQAPGWRRGILLAAVVLSSLVFIYYTRVASVTGSTKPMQHMTRNIQKPSEGGRAVQRNGDVNATTYSQGYTGQHLIPKHYDDHQTKDDQEGEAEKSEAKESLQHVTRSESKTETNPDETTVLDDIEADVASTTEALDPEVGSITQEVAAGSRGDQERPSNNTQQQSAREKTAFKAINYTSTLNSFGVTDRKGFQSLTEKRLSRIKEKCGNHVSEKTPRRRIRQGIIVRNLFNTCVAPKGGSTSWYELRGKVKDLGLVNDEQAFILSVRHPLSRLTSAYRDKFLNGAPISSYDNAWRNATRSSQTWRQRWDAYWFPALISRGEIQPSEFMKMRRTIARNTKKACRATLPSNAVMVHQVERDYRPKMQRYVEQYADVSFTFADFLKHILWTHDFGVMDHHWAPQTCLCDPCRYHYDYVLHLENIGREVRRVFDDLGLPDDVQIGSDHNTKRALNVSDTGYFKGVDEDVIQRIYRLYKDDFELFGYST